MLSPQQQSQLPPLLVAANIAHCYPHPVTLIMKEKLMSWTGDDFKIKDPNGHVFFRIEGKAISFSQKKCLQNPQGQVIANFKKEAFNFLPVYNVFHGAHSEQLMARIESKFTFISTKAKVQLTNVVNGQPAELVLKGDWRSKNAQIYLGNPKEGGRMIANASRKLNAKHVLFGAQDYQVTIEPGVDVALIVLLVLAFDEMAETK
jgi:uncharacterized protein YxjI